MTTTLISPEDCRVPKCERCSTRPASHDVAVPGRAFYARVCDECLYPTERYPEA